MTLIVTFNRVLRRCESMNPARPLQGPIAQTPKTRDPQRRWATRNPPLSNFQQVTPGVSGAKREDRPESKNFWAVRIGARFECRQYVASRDVPPGGQFDRKS